MRQVLSFESPREHYTADACIVWCFDDRFSALLAAFSKSFKNVDLVKVAGGAKALAGGASPERDFVLDQVQASIRLHHTKRIILVVHRDCGAYGGAKSFENPDAEKIHHMDQLAAAEEFLKKKIPDASIGSYFADFDGLYEK